MIPDSLVHSAGKAKSTDTTVQADGWEGRHIQETVIKGEVSW
jgi:hypothetical protein